MTRPALDPGVSLYLDLARISAAVLVLLHHVFGPPYYDGGFHFPGRSAVIVFFVISGYVIAYASDGQADWRPYAVARLARIYSVALPALALTGLLYVAQGLLLPGDVTMHYDHPAARLAVSALFLNQIWNLTVAALTDGPYWSLCYEVWYYVLFGVLCFLRGWRRWLAVGAVCLLVGPRILLLLPIWGLGVGLYHVMRRHRGPVGPGETALFLVSAAVFLVALFGPNPAAPLSAALSDQLHDGYWQLGGVRLFIGGDAQFPSDYLLGLLFAGTVYFSRAVFHPGVAASRWALPVRVASSYTFSLYLFHAPLLIFLNPVLRRWLPADWVPAVTIALIVAAVALLGRVTEHRKAPYMRFFGTLCSPRTAVNP
jgi:peptidoglycan/LPS O-acetylase OafA/YrhL